jgi:hypothetical protein
MLGKAVETIRELHESDTGGEIRLDARAQAAADAVARITADGRITKSDLPDILTVLDLVPQIRADAAESLRYNREINGLYGALSLSEARRKRRSKRLVFPVPTDEVAA